MNAAALERLQSRGDCFQLATAALRQGCAAMDALPISKVQCMRHICAVYIYKI